MDFVDMPIENVKNSQSQGRFFEDQLSLKLKSTNKLYKLRNLINWDELESTALQNLDVKKLGRSRKSPRVMLGLLMLQAMYNGSDSYTEESLEENAYWQYFCGYEYFEKNCEISEATIRRFRNLIGERGLEEIMKELLRVGIKIGSVKKKDLESVITDSTVQIKNIKHPHDVHLMEKARAKLVKLFKDCKISLNDTYAKSFKYGQTSVWKYSKDSKVKQKTKIMRKLKTLLGRLIRVFERGALDIVLSAHQGEILNRVKKIHAQSCLNKREKDKYKESNKVLYSFHAPEVECIGKGKLRKPYEFGNKVSVVISGRNNFVLCAKSFHGNPYDGHILNQTIESLREISKEPLLRVFVDRGYSGNNFSEKGKIYSPNTKKQNLSKDDKKMIKRRSAIEPIIGHLKNFGRMGRNYLKGKIGDIINPISSAIGLNLRQLANHLETLPPGAFT